MASDPGFPDRPDSPLVSVILPSPNHGPRVGREQPDCIVLHYTGMADGASAVTWLCNPVAQVSCHYVVEETGSVLQLVAESRRAWHAGRSSWHGEPDMNSASIGIEIVNPGHDGGLPEFPTFQIEAVAALCRDIAERFGIRGDRVLAHSDIAPGRKQDPGERFPWQRLYRDGLGLWVPARPDDGRTPLRPGDAGEAVTALQSRLASLGYGLEVTGRFEETTEKVVRSFQLRFRPARVDGIADGGTLATLDDVIALAVAGRVAS